MRSLLQRTIFGGLLLRRVLRTLTQIDARLTEQNALLARLADHFAPVLPTTALAAVKGATGVDYLDATEAARVLAYVERTQADVGRAPTEEEILNYLADEATIDLQERLSQEPSR